MRPIYLLSTVAQLASFIYAQEPGTVATTHSPTNAYEVLVAARATFTLSPSPSTLSRSTLSPITHSPTTRTITITPPQKTVKSVTTLTVDPKGNPIIPPSTVTSTTFVVAEKTKSVAQRRNYDTLTWSNTTSCISNATSAIDATMSSITAVAQATAAGSNSNNSFANTEATVATSPEVDFTFTLPVTDMTTVTEISTAFETKWSMTSDLVQPATAAAPIETAIPTTEPGATAATANGSTSSTCPATVTITVTASSPDSNPSTLPHLDTPPQEPIDQTNITPATHQPVTTAYPPPSAFTQQSIEPPLVSSSTSSCSENKTSSHTTAPPADSEPAVPVVTIQTTMPTGIAPVSTSQEITKTDIPKGYPPYLSKTYNHTASTTSTSCTNSTTYALGTGSANNLANTIPPAPTVPLDSKSGIWGRPTGLTTPPGFSTTHQQEHHANVTAVTASTSESLTYPVVHTALPANLATTRPHNSTNLRPGQASCTTTFHRTPAQACTATHYASTTTLGINCWGCVGEQALPSATYDENSVCPSSAFLTLPYSTKTVCHIPDATRTHHGSAKSKTTMAASVGAPTASSGFATSLSSSTGAGASQSGNWTGYGGNVASHLPMNQSVR